MNEELPIKFKKGDDLIIDPQQDSIQRRVGYQGIPTLEILRQAFDRINYNIETPTQRVMVELQEDGPYDPWIGMTEKRRVAIYYIEFKKFKDNNSKWIWLYLGPVKK